MGSEVVGPCECLPTDLAVVRFLSTVHTHVALKHGGLDVLPTYLADIAPRLARGPLGFGGGGVVVVVGLDPCGGSLGGPIRYGHGEWEDVDG